MVVLLIQNPLLTPPSCPAVGGSMSWILPSYFSADKMAANVLLNSTVT